MSIDESREHSDRANLFTEVADILSAQDDVDDTLATICQLAVKVLGGDHASVTTVVNGEFRTVASTDAVAVRTDHLQYSHGEGPCLDALRDRDTYRTDELASEELWPRFGPAAAEQMGIHSMLSSLLSMEDGSSGALNVFAARPAAFTEAHEELVAIFGAQASIALRAAGEHERAENLSAALLTSRRIGMAMGILMCSEGLDEHEAFARLSRVSQNSNSKLADVAADVVDSGRL
jgi:GAF domain-containing protein